MLDRANKADQILVSPWPPCSRGLSRKRRGRRVFRDFRQAVCLQLPGGNRDLSRQSETAQACRGGRDGGRDFENPAGGEPIVVRQKIWPSVEKTTIESPPLRCVVKDKPYSVSIDIEGPDGAIMQTIKTMMTSSLDQKLLPDRPLVIGPAYEPNPELAGRPSGKLDVTNEAGCPAPV